MEDFIESKNYKLTKKEETEIITDINNLLKNFEKLLKLTTFEMNSRKIIDASLICESMLNLLLKKEGYLLKDNTNFSEIIIFCSNNNLLPVECLKFIDIIRIYNLNIEKGLKPNPDSRRLITCLWQIDDFDKPQQSYYSQNKSKGFVPVKLGQGNGDSTFGPEIGIAEELHERDSNIVHLQCVLCDERHGRVEGRHHHIERRPLYAMEIERRCV